MMRGWNQPNNDRDEQERLRKAGRLLARDVLEILMNRLDPSPFEGFALHQPLIPNEYGENYRRFAHKDNPWEVGRIGVLYGLSSPEIHEMDYGTTLKPSKPELDKLGYPLFLISLIDESHVSTKPHVWQFANGTSEVAQPALVVTPHAGRRVYSVDNDYVIQPASGDVQRLAVLWGNDAESALRTPDDCEPPVGQMARLAEAYMRYDGGDKTYEVIAHQAVPVTDADELEMLGMFVQQVRSGILRPKIKSP